jgi:hypothetical protein
VKKILDFGLLTIVAQRTLYYGRPLKRILDCSWHGAVSTLYLWKTCEEDFELWILDCLWPFSVDGEADFGFGF